MRMSERSMESFVRTLASGIDRRSAVAVALLALAGSSRTAEAGTCRNLKERCKRSSQCCSGLCKGRKNMTCRAHDTSGCRPTPESCPMSIPCTTSLGLEGYCYTTTGNAGFCAHTGFCGECTKDTDYQSVFGPRSACVAGCDLCPLTGGSACIRAGEGPVPMG